MKKMKKILCTLAAITMAAGCNVSAFAQNSYDILDVNKDELKLVISNETSTGRNELWVDNTYQYLISHLFKTTVAVRMTDGTEPPSIADSNSNDIQKLTDIQKVNLLCRETVWFMDVDDIDLSDELYVVRGFETAEAAEEYCKELVDSGKADYAEPIVTGELCYAHPANKTLLDYFKKAGINYDESKLDEINAFNSDMFIFSVSCKDETATVEYLKENIEGFEECVSIAMEEGSTIYFQFENNADNETTTNVLKQMCDMESISNPMMPMYSQLINKPNIQVNAIPENYKSGDADMNEKIDLYDVVTIAKHMLGNFEMDDARKILADYDDSGEVDLYDAIGIAKILMS